MRQISTVLIKKEHRRSIQNVKAILGEFQYAIVIADIDKKKIRKVVKKTFAERRKNIYIYIYIQKKDKFAERCEYQETILRKSN